MNSTIVRVCSSNRPVGIVKSRPIARFESFTVFSSEITSFSDEGEGSKESFFIEGADLVLRSSDEDDDLMLRSSDEGVDLEHGFFFIGKRDTWSKFPPILIVHLSSDTGSTSFEISSNGD